LVDGSDPDAIRCIERGSRIFRPIAESAFWLLQSFCGGISQASLDLLFGFGISDLHPIHDSADLEGTAILRENS
jgi:hypothetical protein